MESSSCVTGLFDTFYTFGIFDTFVQFKTIIKLINFINQQNVKTDRYMGQLTWRLNKKF